MNAEAITPAIATTAAKIGRSADRSAPVRIRPKPRRGCLRTPAPEPSSNWLLSLAEDFVVFDVEPRHLVGHEFDRIQHGRGRHNPPVANDRHFARKRDAQMIQNAQHEHAAVQIATVGPRGTERGRNSIRVPSHHCPGPQPAVNTGVPVCISAFFMICGCRLSSLLRCKVADLMRLDPGRQEPIVEVSFVKSIRLVALVGHFDDDEVAGRKNARPMPCPPARILPSIGRPLRLR